MPILKFAGNLLAVLGFVCGVFLLLSPLTAVAAMGLLLAGKALALGSLFVLLSAIGLLLGGLGGAGKEAVHRLLFLMGSGWLALGILAIVALIAHLVGLLNAELTMVWWLMAAGCSIFGALALTIGAPSAPPNEAANSPQP